MNTRELNKKLSSTLLTGRDGEYIRNIYIRVNRARLKQTHLNSRNTRHEWTEVDITIWAEIQNISGEWKECHTYGIKDSRNFLRRERNLVSGMVNDWTRLWGFPTNDLKIKTIKFGLSPDCLSQHPPIKRRRYWY